MGDADLRVAAFDALNDHISAAETLDQQVFPNAGRNLIEHLSVTDVADGVCCSLRPRLIPWIAGIRLRVHP